MEIQIVPKDSLQSLLKGASIFVQDVQKMFGDIKEITSQEQYAKVGQGLSEIKKLYKKADEKRKDLLAPAKEEIDEINQQFKTVLEPIPILIETLSELLKDFWKKEELKQAIEMKKLEDARQKEAKENNMDVADMPPVIVPVLPKTVKAGGRSTTMMKRWTYQIQKPIEELQLTVEQLQEIQQYLIWDTAKIYKAVQAGVRKIPYIDIYEELSPTSR